MGVAPLFVSGEMIFPKPGPTFSTFISTIPMIPVILGLGPTGWAKTVVGEVRPTICGTSDRPRTAATMTTLLLKLFTIVVPCDLLRGCFCRPPFELAGLLRICKRTERAKDAKSLGIKDASPIVLKFYTQTSEHDARWV